MLGKFLCFLGLHKWWNSYSEITRWRVKQEHKCMRKGCTAKKVTFRGMM